jgi:hypothetical protein
MKSVQVKGFLSCSFQDSDREICQLFRAVCEGLDIDCVNVDRAWNEVPPDRARKLIEECKVIVAVATQREQLHDGSFNMPPAVRDEISIAYALKKPLVWFKEKGVNLKGFLQNYGTHLEFERTGIHEPNFLKKVISSVHDLKLTALASEEVMGDQDTQGVLLERMHAMFELKKEDGCYVWVCTTNRLFRFTKPYESRIKAAAWPVASANGGPAREKIVWSVIKGHSSRPFTISTDVERDSPEVLEVSSKVDPVPNDGDTLELTHVFKARHLNQILRSDTGFNGGCLIGNRHYDCCDGLVPIFRTKELKLRIIFPQDYGILTGDIEPIVCAYSAGIDYPVETEKQRCKVSKENFAGTVLYTIEVESPLPRHIYGAAWNLPSAGNGE